MSLRALAILIGLIVAGGLYLLMSGERSAPADIVGELFIPELSEHLNDIDSVRIAKGGDRTVAAIARGTSRWTVSNESGYPADLGKIRALLIALSQARILELKTAKPELHARLGVEDVTREDATGTLIELAHGDDTTAIILGINTAGEGNQQYARRAEDNQSVLIAALPDPGTTSEEWLDRQIANIAAADIEMIEVDAADGGAFTIRRSETNADEFELLDIPAGRTLDPTAVKSLSGALTDLQFDSVKPEPTDRDGDVSEPITKTVFSTRTGLIVTATAMETNGGTWIRLDADQAAPAEREAIPSDAPAPTADELRQRWSNWRYLLPGFKADQLTRSIADILTPEN